MTAKTLQFNSTVITTPHDAGKTNSAPPSPAQLASGWIPNIDSVNAEQQNYLHNASTSLIYLMQLLGLALPFNPDPVSGLSLVGTPAGGIVSLINNATNATEFYVARNTRTIGYSDPSLDPTNWALINFNAIATYSNPYSDATGTSDAVIVTYQSIIYPVLLDGFRVTVGIATPNGTTTPTLQVILNGSTQTARTIKKRNQSGALMPLAIGDLFGSCTFEFDLPILSWVLTNPPGHEVQPGTVIVYAGTTVPVGYLQLPNTLTNISRTAYPALFAAISTQWGAGDGSTTFGLPYVPPGWSILQALGWAVVGAQTPGQVIAHSHTVAASYNGTGSTWLSTTSNVSPGAYATSATGGAANYAAGVGFNLAIKY